MINLKIQKYIDMENCEVPDDINNLLKKQSNITKTEFENKNEILINKSLQEEIGYCKMQDGNYLVSMVCPMPNVTKEMVDWWFWWHPQNNKRYIAWYPSQHFKISYDKKQKDYFNSTSVPKFIPNTQYPLENVGNTKMPLAINFKNPIDYGFDKTIMEKNNIATIVCGTVGAFHNLFMHTEMAHIFIQTENGLQLVSRFWIGKRLKNKLIRGKLLNDETAQGMAIHCCVEYRNFAKKIPLMYKEYIEENKNNTNYNFRDI